MKVVRRLGFRPPPTPRPLPRGRPEELGCHPRSPRRRRARDVRRAAHGSAALGRAGVVELRERPARTASCVRPRRCVRRGCVHRIHLGGGLGPKRCLARSLAIASGLVAASSQRVAPPHRGQVETSISKTCRSSQAHGFLRGSGGSTVSARALALSCLNSGSCTGSSSTCGTRHAGRNRAQPRHREPPEDRVHERCRGRSGVVQLLRKRWLHANRVAAAHRHGGQCDRAPPPIRPRTRRRGSNARGSPATR